jgi:hypothetical protein
MGHQAIPMILPDMILSSLGRWQIRMHREASECHGFRESMELFRLVSGCMPSSRLNRKGSLGGLFLGGGFLGGLGRLGGFLVAEVVELFGVALGLGVFFGADFEVGEELAEEGGVLVLELEMGAAFACFDEADLDELFHMRGEIAITQAEDGTKLGDGDFMLLHEEKKAQTTGIGKSGEKGEQGGHGGADAHHAEAGVAREMANVTKK